MKFLILLILFSVGVSGQVAAQKKTVYDTIGYLKHMEAKKTAFIGQPFSKFLSSLKLGIVTFGPIMSNPSDVSKEPSTIFMFLNPTTAEDYRYPYIRIIWRSALNFDTSSAIARRSGIFGGWTGPAIANYQNAIVADILIGGAGTDRPAPAKGWLNWKDVTAAGKKKVNKSKNQ